MKDELTQQLDDHSQWSIQSAPAPSLDSLHERVGQVRSRRRRLRVGSSLAAIVCLMGTLVYMNQEETPAPIVDDVPMELALNTDASPPETQQVADVPPSEPQQRSQPRIQLYANVVGAAPVFDFNEDTQSMHHVGWIESERRVPVDMKYVPDRQQKTFNAALSSTDDWRIEF